MDSVNSKMSKDYDISNVEIFLYVTFIEIKHIQSYNHNDLLYLIFSFKWIFLFVLLNCIAGLLIHNHETILFIARRTSFQQVLKI